MVFESPLGKHFTLETSNNVHFVTECAV
jgi:hypothetical protein